MALTTEKIHATADQIVDLGERPTLARIRKALGGGSFTTISEAMQEWREKQTEEHALAEVEVPEAISERVDQLKAAAWEAAVAEAESRLSAERQSLGEAQAQAAGSVEEAEEAVQMLEGEAVEREHELATLRDQLADSETLVKNAMAARQEAEQRREADAAQLGERISGLESRLADAQEARKVAEAREVTAVQDVKDIGKALEEVRFRLSEAERAQATADAHAQERGDALHKEQEARKALEAALSAAREQHRSEINASLKQSEDALKTARERHESELEEWRRMHDATQETASDAVARVTQLEEKNAGLEARLADAQKFIERLPVLDERHSDDDPNTGAEEEQRNLW